MKTFVNALILSAILTACSGAAKDENLITMGFTPAESTDKVTSNGQVIGDLLEKATGYKYKIYVASDYTALVESHSANASAKLRSMSYRWRWGFSRPSRRCQA